MRTVYALLLVILLPAAALAQPRAFAVSERPAAGVFLGPSGNSEQYSGDSGRDVGFVFDTPIVFGYRLRADASRVDWSFKNANYAPGIVASDRVTMKSVRLSFVAMRHLAARTASYAGAGYGVYHFDYNVAPLRKPWRGGLNALAGLEILSAKRGYAFNGEVRLHAINGARQLPLPASVLLELDAAIGMKVRF